MFTLRIHTVDTSQELFAVRFGDDGGGGGATSGTKSGGLKPKSKKQNDLFSPTELKGVVHLFRNLPSPTSATTSSLFSVTARTTLVFVAAVPNYLSSEEFIAFCESHVDHFADLCFIRNDAVEDRYSVLITLVNQMSADAFCCSYNGKPYKASEPEVCHVYFIQLVEYTNSAETASKPQPGYTELPTCPVCLERLDHDTSAIQITLCDHSFRCSCVSKWASLSCQVCRLCQQQDPKPTCAVCGTSKNPWVCLICGFVGCGRYEDKHAIRHWSDTQHCYSLELETQQIWDYVGDKYVHRLNQSKTDSKSVVSNLQCTSLEGGIGHKEDAEVGQALFSSKVDVIVDEYNYLLASQMESQRQNYGTLLAEAKSRKETAITEAIEKAEAEKTQEIQSKLEELAKDIKAVSHINEDFSENQEALKKEYKEIQEREAASLKSKDEQILDLQEQIRDLKVYIETQRTIAKSNDTDGIKGGTVLPVQSNPSNPKRNSKRQGRKRN